MNYKTLNYLNMINARIGERYKKTGRSPLPSGFVVDNETIAERIKLNNSFQIKTFPEFLFNERDSIKKNFKISLNNIKSLQKNQLLEQKNSKEFLSKLQTYLEARRIVTQAIIKDFNLSNFVESDAYEELFQIDPIMFNLLSNIFEKDFDENSFLESVEGLYTENLSSVKTMAEQKKQAKSSQKRLQEQNEKLVMQKAEKQIKEQVIDKKRVTKQAKNTEKEKQQKLKEIL